MAETTGEPIQATAGQLASSTSILDGYFRVVFTHLRANMNNMFEKSDLAFRDFADKVQSGVSHIRFMEAMGIIQRNRADLEKHFYQKVLGDFKKFGRPGQADAIRPMDRDEPLELVSIEDEDIQVALLNMVESASLGATHELFALRQRLAVLNQGRKLEPHQVPAGPACLAQRFHEAAGMLDLEHETRLIVYMLFGKFVLGKLFTMYEEYNQHLVKAGVLPNLKYKVRKNRETPRPEQRKAAEPAANATTSEEARALGEELFGNIMQLLSRREIEMHGGAEDGGMVAGPPIPQAEVVSAIHRMQLQGQPEIDDGITPERIVSGAVSEKEVRASLHARLSAVWDQLFAGIDRRRMPAADTQVIDLVGMMFEYLLNEESLPSVAKVELCRLHTPYLKVAIIDKNMFSDVGHPAHDLLNTMIAAGSRWVFEDDLERGIFPTIRNIVQRIVDGFDQDLDIFTELLDLLKDRLDELEIRSTAVEKRTRQAAQGKEKLRQARSRSEEAIDSLLAGRPVPGAIRKALSEVWTDKLMFIFLREPQADHSPAWNLAIETIGQIIWSVEPRTDDAARAELEARLPEARDLIAQAFEELDSYGRTDNEAQLELIREYQETALSAPPPQPAAEEAEITPQVSAPVAEPDSGMTESVTGAAVEPEPAPPVAEEDYTPEFRDALLLLSKVVPGTWFAFEEPDRPVVRWKLSWHSDASDEYMFVDSLGNEASVLSRDEFASLIVEGRTHIIRHQQPSFMQRAMQTIRGMLADEDELFDKSVIRE